MRRPAPTIRLRLTAAYGCLFLLSGAAVLAMTYALVRHEYTGTFFLASGKQAAFSVVTKGPNGVTVRRDGVARVVPPTLKQQLALAENPKLVAAAARGQSDAALRQLLIDSGIALAIMAMLSIWLGWLLA